MLPVKTLKSNFVYRGPTPDVGDLDCERVELGHIRSAWKLTSDEVAWIAAGAHVELDIHTEPIPPVALNVTEPMCGPCGSAMELVTETRTGQLRAWVFRCPLCRRDVDGVLVPADENERTQRGDA